MENVNNDMSNKIISNTELLFIITTILFICGGLAMIIVGAVHGVGGVIGGGVALLVLSPLIWLFKPFFDGYGIIVQAAEKQLANKEIQYKLEDLKEQEQTAEKQKE